MRRPVREFYVLLNLMNCLWLAFVMFENDLSPPLPSNITKKYETENAKRKETLPGKLELQIYVRAPVAFFFFNGDILGLCAFITQGLLSVPIVILS